MDRSLQQAEMDKIVSLCKRRGFIFQSSEIYGGLASTYDYGPLGIELKRNIRDSWWKRFIQDRDDMVGLESAILMHPQVWVASGHADTFTDPLVECKACHQRFRADHVDSQTCPECGGELTDPRSFNLMFKTFIGPVEDSASQAYLRPETAQGIFVNFQNVLVATRKRLPFGIGQIGKSFRNEITTGNFTFRTREFEQMEIEYFVRPGTDEEWHGRWMDEFMAWFTDLGIRPDRLRLRKHADEELSHYAKATSDIEYSFAWGWGELMGIANRTDFDLKAHAAHSGNRLEYFDDETHEHLVPYVVEPALGRRPRPARLPVRRLRRGDRGGRHPRGAAPAPFACAGEGGSAAPEPQRAPGAQGTRGVRHGARELRGAVRRRPIDRPPLPPPGRDRHAAGGHGRLQDGGGGQRRDHPGPGHDAADARAHPGPAAGAGRAAWGVGG